MVCCGTAEIRATSAECTGTEGRTWPSAGAADIMGMATQTAIVQTTGAWCSEDPPGLLGDGISWPFESPQWLAVTGFIVMLAHTGATAPLNVAKMAASASVRRTK